MKHNLDNITSQKWGARHICEPHDHKSGGLEPLGPIGVYAYDYSCQKRIFTQWPMRPSSLNPPLYVPCMPCGLALGHYCQRQENDLGESLGKHLGQIPWKLLLTSIVAIRGNIRRMQSLFSFRRSFSRSPASFCASATWWVWSCCWRTGTVVCSGWCPFCRSSRRAAGPPSKNSRSIYLSHSLVVFWGPIYKISHDNLTIILR